MHARRLLLLVLLAMPSTAEGQRLAPPVFAPAAPVVPRLAMAATAVPRIRERPEPTTGDVILGSLLGGIGTCWLPAYVASRFHATPCEDCGLEEGIYGGAMGFGLGASVGAHLANRRQRSFLTSALLTTAIGAAGALAALESDQAELLLAVPIAQVATAVAIERRGRRH